MAIFDGMVTEGFLNRNAFVVYGSIFVVVNWNICSEKYNILLIISQNIDDSSTNFITFFYYFFLVLYGCAQIKLSLSKILLEKWTNQSSSVKLSCRRKSRINSRQITYVSQRFSTNWVWNGLNWFIDGMHWATKWSMTKSYFAVFPFSDSLFLSLGNS